ncbi:MAG: hypothetical protein Q4F88_02630 [Eubacteriales bacterium]|nr:hypothetical protein [Eubacteriales bacterium]
MKLKTIGCFKEMPYGYNNGKSIKDYISDNEASNKKEIINYLNQGICIAACCGVSEDVINPNNGIIGVPDVLVDGKYQWYRDIIYYIEKYNLKLPKEFIEYAKINKWHINITEKDIDEDDISIIENLYN